MLLPSALTCESTSSLSSPKPSSYFPPTTLFASPPISPPTTTTSLSYQTPASSSNSKIGNIYSTCRALQSMLTTPSQLPSPPTQHQQLASSIPIISSPFKLRLRNRGIKNEESSAMTPRKKIGKRAPPRGVNKRRRAIDDESSREMAEDSDSENEDRDQDEKENIVGQEQREQEQHERDKEGPRTPKRIRLAPEILPLGLDRSDFHALHLQHQLSSQPLFFPSSSSLRPSNSNADPFSDNNNTQQQEIERENEEQEEWSTEDDRLLVELVLEKLKLSKSEWQDCARSLGRDRGSVGRRWESLMAVGDVGLKGRPKAVNQGGMGGKRMKRGRIYGSWR
ncbi:hypothetical protein BDZ45DRAFT_667750 [Acephala macrosclerotiorum]|nr:hypothetical protein BDZ45DRAFT_667750 [Acephala macrosclerotiorum]